MNAAVVRVRKAYFDCRFGQLHVRTAFSSSGGFDEKTTLLCLHPSGASGRLFDALLPLLGANRSVYAPDAPGAGESDAAAGPLTGACAAALLDFLDSMRFRQIDLLAVGDSAATAAEIARARPALIRKRLDIPGHEAPLFQSQPEILARRARNAFD